MLKRNLSLENEYLVRGLLSKVYFKLDEFNEA